MSNTLTQNPYVTKFENMLKPLQSRLSELELNLDSIKDDHPYKQQARLDILVEINKTKQDIENTEKNLECSKTMNIIRSNKVPVDILDHNVWNDCWYDEKRKLYVTYNEHFETLDDVCQREHQINYSKETNDDGLVFKEEGVKFIFGHPSIRIDYEDGTFANFLLPTMTDNMLTDEIVKARLRPKSNEKSIMYKTESESWITIGTKGLSLCEKENEISDKLELYPKVPMEELKTLYGRK